jgi:hypothetical protein
MLSKISRDITDDHIVRKRGDEEMKVGSINAAQKQEQVALKELTGLRRDPAIVDDDLDGWGDAWPGLLEEEDTLFSMQDWEGKKRKKIR